VLDKVSREIVTGKTSGSKTSASNKVQNGSTGVIICQVWHRLVPTTHACMDIDYKGNQSQRMLNESDDDDEIVIKLV